MSNWAIHVMFAVLPDLDNYGPIRRKGELKDSYPLVFILGIILLFFLLKLISNVIFNLLGPLFEKYLPVHATKVHVVFVGTEEVSICNSNINPCIKGNRILLDSQQGKKIELVDPNKIFTPADENHKGIVTYKGDLVISFHQIEP